MNRACPRIQVMHCWLESLCDFHSVMQRLRLEKEGCPDSSCSWHACHAMLQLQSLCCNSRGVGPCWNARQSGDTPLVDKLLENTKKDVSVEAPLVGLIQHDNRILLQL